MEQDIVRVDSRLMEEVRTYSRITGVSISRCLDEAIGNWTECEAVCRLSDMHEGIKKRREKAKEKGFQVKLTVAEQELLARYKPQSDPKDGETVNGKACHAYHLHNQDPVPAKWRQKGAR